MYTATGRNLTKDRILSTQRLSEPAWRQHNF